MRYKTISSPYHNSLSKSVLDTFFALFSLILSSPLFLLISTILKLSDSGPVFFIHKRIGKNGKVFKLIKFRTMIPGSEKNQKRYKHFNEADGPVFKILNDPRYTKLGKFLAHTGLDELPQLINVLKGEMSLVGPRPLPLPEAKRLTKVQKIRELIKPGITSSWVVSGSHRLTFNKWMKLDEDYVKNASFAIDIKILAKTVFIMLRQMIKQALLILPS